MISMEVACRTPVNGWTKFNHFSFLSLLFFLPCRFFIARVVHRRFFFVSAATSPQCRCNILLHFPARFTAQIKGDADHDQFQQRRHVQKVGRREQFQQLVAPQGLKEVQDPFLLDATTASSIDGSKLGRGQRIRHFRARISNVMLQKVHHERQAGALDFGQCKGVHSRVSTNTVVIVVVTVIIQMKRIGNELALSGGGNGQRKGLRRMGFAANQSDMSLLFGGGGGVDSHGEEALFGEEDLSA
mmetsp:Transcript_4278/g.11673  ORF Transcript_4278/g.11673 Transcript_4278/m.11673 type:complete len:243 (-) Transcript_4278:75-803(-)